MGIGEGVGADPPQVAPPTLANTDNMRLAPTCPLGQAAASFDSLIGRRSSNVESQVVQRYSYSAIPNSLVAPQFRRLR